jgi:putative spermidine/putrescine transport system ATP-binding protein
MRAGAAARPAEEGKALVDVRGVDKRFGDTLAVSDASLSVARGDFLTILGPSGCGKTTLLRMIAGFLSPTRGEIRIGGAPMTDTPPHRRSIGMVFQRLALFPHMSAAENVAYPLKMRGFAKAEIPDRVARYLNLVRLDGFGARRPHELSGGQQQRVAIARALSFGPDLLLLDEPLSALDKKLREEMQLEFRRIQQELGVTTINVTHDQREALVMSDRIVVMEGGRVRQDATPEEVYLAPRNRFVAGFLGMTSMVRGEVESDGPDGPLIRVGAMRLRGRPGPSLAPGAAVDCAIRAERIRILEGAEAGGCDAEVEAVVEQRIFEGDRVAYELRAPALGDARLFAFDHDHLSHGRHAARSTVRVGWNAADLLPFPADDNQNPSRQGDA